VSGIVKTIRNQHRIAQQRAWDRMYWAVDLHSTLILPTYGKMMADDVEYYPHALDVMRTLTQRRDIRLILYTCSWPVEIVEYQKRFTLDGIRFDWVGENPEVHQTEYGFYERKPYFNVLLDDKAGFDAQEDWARLAAILTDLPLLEEIRSAEACGPCGAQR